MINRNRLLFIHFLLYKFLDSRSKLLKYYYTQEICKLAWRCLLYRMKENGSKKDFIYICVWILSCIYMHRMKKTRMLMMGGITNDW